MDVLPFNLKKKDYDKLTKIPGITNWMFAMNRKRNRHLTVTYWVADGLAKYNSHGYFKGTHGTGYSSGANDSMMKNFVRRDIEVMEIHYDAQCDSWILRDRDGQFHRAPWPNAYRNSLHPHHENREDVRAVMDSCDGLTIWE